jgi:hypothetical protein
LPRPTARPALRPPRPELRVGRRLALGLGAWTLALLVARLMQLAVARHEQLGNSQLAADGRAMAWVPALLAIAGTLFLGGALWHGLRWLLRWPHAAAAPHRAPRPPQRWVGQPAPRPAPRHRPLVVAAAARDPHHWAWAMLGLVPGTPWAEIRAHWRRQLRQWHPDAGGDLDLWYQRQAAYRLLAAQLRR